MEINNTNEKSYSAEKSKNLSKMKLDINLLPT